MDDPTTLIGDLINSLKNFKVVDRTRLRVLAIDPDAEVDVDEIRRQLAELVEDEAVVHADDLLLRRTGWGDDPAAAAELAGALDTLLPQLTR